MEIINGSVLKRYRMEKNMSLNDVAKETRRTKGYISRLENGSAFANIEMASKLKNVLDIPDELFSKEVLEEFEVIKNSLNEKSLDLTSVRKGVPCFYEGKVVPVEKIEKILNLLNEE